MKQLLDTRDVERIRLALTIVSYPGQYCLKAENLQRLDRLLPSTDGVRYLVTLLHATQEALVSHLPLPFQSAWSLRDTTIGGFVPTTTYTGSTLPKGNVDEFAKGLDRGLLEDALETMAKDMEGPASPAGISLALACSWLSQHLALIAIGLAKAELVSSSELLITPSSSDAERQLRRLWFAAAFEELSMRKAEASLAIYALLASANKSVKGNVDSAFVDAVTIIPQHWRLPADTGPVADLLGKQLMPLIWLVGHVSHAAQFDNGRPIVAANLPPPKAYRKVFADVMAHQLALLPLNRLFEIKKGGLVLGPRKLAPGLLRIAEDMATAQLGATWHDKALSNTQKKYLIGRLERLPSVQVIDVEVSKHDTTDGILIDVDLFIRDQLNGILFAVQLKHFKYSDKGGLRYWLGRFQPDKSMAHAIAQLESFRALAKSDSKVRNKLFANGIEAKELEQVVPIVLHNIGFLDCLEFQEGVLAYDQHTFVNVLDGRSAVGVGVVDGQAVNLRIPSSQKRCRLNYPDEIISAYVNDPKFADVRHFDAAAEVTRRAEIMGSIVTARGLGI